VSRWVGLGVLAVVAWSGALAGAHAQDIEALAEIRGLTLPQGYYDRLLQNPDVFELPEVWRGQRPQAVDGAAMPVAGQFRLLIIPALFKDSEPPRFPVEEIRRVIFDGPSEAGTLTDFYDEASGGLLSVEGVVAPWVRTSLTVAEAVGESFGLGDDTGTGDYLVEAVALADEFIDFTQFDNDGPDGIPNSGDDDGIVDVVNFEFQEVSASCGGPAIWPHRSAMVFWLGGALATADMAIDGDPMFIFGYTITGASDCTGETLQTAGGTSIIPSTESSHRTGGGCSAVGVSWPRAPGGVETVPLGESASAPRTSAPGPRIASAGSSGSTWMTRSMRTSFWDRHSRVARRSGFRWTTTIRSSWCSSTVRRRASMPTCRRPGSSCTIGIWKVCAGPIGDRRGPTSSPWSRRTAVQTFRSRP